MPTLKRTPSVMRFHFRNLLVLGLPFAAVLAAGMYFGMKERLGVAVASWVLGFAIAVVGLVRQERNLRQLECPTCRQVLRRKRGKPGERISFLCLPCDTEWDTGFHESTD